MLLGLWVKSEVYVRVRLSCSGYRAKPTEKAGLPVVKAYPHTVRWADLLWIYRELRSSPNDKPPPVLISSLPSPLCLLDHWWRADAGTPRGIEASIHSKHATSISPGRHLFPRPSLSPQRPELRAPWPDCWGMREDCYCRRGQRRRGGRHSVLLDGPQVPDVTLFNGIIMTVLRLPLALSLHTVRAHTHKHTKRPRIIIQSLSAHHL